MLNLSPDQLDYFELIKGASKPPEEKSFPKIRVAVMADFSSQHLVKLLKA